MFSMSIIFFPCLSLVCSAHRNHKSIGFHGIEDTDSSCWKLNIDLISEKEVLLNGEPSTQAIYQSHLEYF